MEISQMLDALAEYQAQVEYLNLRKQELLDEVKVPVEVLASQDEANKQRQKLDSEFWARQKAREEAKKAMLAEVKDPEMPPEFVAALAAARQKRNEIEAQFSQDAGLDQDHTAATKSKIDADLQSKIQDVYKQVASRKAEIIAEFDDKASGALDNIAKLTAEIKGAVVKLGETVKGQFYQAVYVKGRVTWNTDMLDGMVIAFPALAKARKEGAPSVTLRKVGG